MVLIDFTKHCIRILIDCHHLFIGQTIHAAFRLLHGIGYGFIHNIRNLPLCFLYFFCYKIMDFVFINSHLILSGTGFPFRNQKASDKNHNSHDKQYNFQY